jgi:hypothetical protein
VGWAVPLNSRDREFLSDWESIGPRIAEILHNQILNFIQHGTESIRLNFIDEFIPCRDAGEIDGNEGRAAHSKTGDSKPVAAHFQIKARRQD